MSATATGNLAKALLEFQADAPQIQLDATNPHFRNRYASLAGVVAAIRPALNKVGLVYTQLPGVTELGQPAVETRLIHAASGEVLSSTMPLLLPQQTPQGHGSALTYARRYALLSILGLVGDEDDDANTASSGGGTTTGQQAGSTQRKPATAKDAAASSTAFKAPDGAEERDPDPLGLQASRADATLDDVTTLVIHFGKNQGKTLSDLSEKSRKWYAETWEPNPQYATDKDWALKNAARQLCGLSVGGSDTDEIPFAPRWA